MSLSALLRSDFLCMLAHRGRHVKPKLPVGIAKMLILSDFKMAELRIPERNDKGSVLFIGGAAWIMRVLSPTLFVFVMNCL